MANTGVRGRLVFAGSDPPEGIKGVTVSAYDIDRLTADEHLGTAVTADDGTFNITYTPFAYRTWSSTANPYIEVRIFGDGHRLLWATPKQDEVQVDVLDVGTIQIHKNNFRVPESATVEEKRNDRSWLVTHTSLDPARFLPIRLSAGNQIDWLVDGAAMFPAVTDAVAAARRSIKLVNLGFAVDDLFSKFEFPPGKDHKTVEDGDVVNVHRLERIMAHKADAENVLVHVFSWDLASSGVFLGGLLDDIDLADEVEEYFANTNVFTDALEGSQLLHIKMVVVDGQKAFVIGSTMKQGYFNDQEHAIRDARHGGRQLMHDVSLCVTGPATRYVDQTFTTLWGAGSTGTSVAPDEQLPEADTEVSVQVLRTLPGELFTSETPDPDTENLPYGEPGILEAHQRAIMKAEEYIYVEDQYFTSDEIATALKLRMAEKPDLEVILVLNVKPDIPGYSKRQAALIKDLRKSLGKRRNRLGVFTMWSSDADQSTYEIAPIYVHAKLTLIDDTWATVGTANLDGASLNQRQWGLILAGVFEQLSSLKKVLVTLGRGPTDHRLFLAPAVAKVQEGDPLEKVIFARDEMTNMVWAVEERIPGVLGSGVDGFESATALSRYFSQRAPADGVVPEASEASIRYVLGTSVPENWIPFIARHRPGSQRLIRLQRAAMPRLTDALPASRVEPRGRVLRTGLDGFDPRRPYFLHEEEVPRAGAIVTRGFQRARWFDGKVYTWIGRRKETGRGQGASGLVFDRVVPLQTEPNRL